jgi:hypothetical protein
MCEPGLLSEIKMKQNMTYKFFWRWISLVLLCMLAGCNLTTAPTPSKSIIGIQDGIYAIDTYKLKFEKGQFTLLTQYDQEWTRGSFSVNNNRITFTETDFAPECGPENSPYSYQWSFDGKALNFSNPDDKCLGRIQFMTEQPWMLSDH